MAKTKYIIFKSGRPWRRYFGELEFINDYSRLFDEFMDDPGKDWLAGTSMATTVEGRFFRKYQPAKLEKDRYVSLFKDFVLGNEEREEAPLIANLEFEELLEQSKEEFYNCNEIFECKLARLNCEQIFEEPLFTQRRGTSNLSINPLARKENFSAC